MELTRRSLLKGLGAAALAGCGGRWISNVPTRDRGAQARSLLSSVDHLVVLMMENRSFDHALGSLSLDSAYPSRALLNGLTGNETNPDVNGRPIGVFPLPCEVAEDPPHSWHAAHGQFNGGANDGFVREFIRQHGWVGPQRPMGFYTRDRLGVLHALADQFTVCDRWFASVMGPTWPNRWYLHAGTSFGATGNLPQLDSSLPTIWDALDGIGVSAQNYFGGSAAWYSVGFLGKVLSGHSVLRPTRLHSFFRDAQDGTLPSFSLIDPDWDVCDDHPPHSVKLGQAFLASVVNALAQGPGWSRTLLVVLYDEHGGFFDHVPPPEAPDADPRFRRLGFRVPAILVGPMVKRGAVCSTTLEHASIASTLSARFGVDDLSLRTNAAADLSVAIDPAVLSNAQSLAPPQLPVVALTRGDLAASNRTKGQPELTRLIDSLPNEHRADDEARRVESWLDHAQRTGAVTLAD